MLTFDEMYFLVRHDGATSLHFRNEEGPPYGRSLYTDFDKWIAFLEMRNSVLRENYHVLVRNMELWTFIDTDQQDYSPGVFELTCKAYNMRIPFHVARLIAAHLKEAYVRVSAAAEGLSENERFRLDEERVEFTKADREYWLSYYGIGKGRAQFTYQNDEQRQRFEACLAKYQGRDDEEATSFMQMVENLKGQCLGRTACADDVGVVKISHDHAGFFWEIEGGMHGGLIHHDRDDNGAGGNWSLHT